MADLNRANAALARLLAIQCRSLPMYLAETTDSASQGDAKIARLLGHIVADQKALSQRVGELLVARLGRADLPGFPMEFTDTHFLSLQYLLGDLVTRQKADITAIQHCVDLLADDAQGLSLAQEALGAEKAHLEMLAELARQPAGSSS